MFEAYCLQDSFKQEKAFIYVAYIFTWQLPTLGNINLLPKVGGPQKWSAADLITSASPQIHSFSPYNKNIAYNALVQICTK